MTSAMRLGMNSKADYLTPMAVLNPHHLQPAAKLSKLVFIALK